MKLDEIFKKSITSKSKALIEDFNPEYDDESGMAHNKLHTLSRAVQGLMDIIDDQENLPEWVQEKISDAEGMLVSVWDYLQSQEEQGINPKIDGAGHDVLRPAR